jgi:TonB family protein
MSATTLRRTARRSLLATASLVLFLLASGAAAQAPPAGEPYRVGGEVLRPEKISGLSPVYTEAARRARVQGVVIIEAIIDEAGNVTDAKVLKGLPMGLDQSAHEAIKTWKFKPATLDGQPVKVYYVLTVNFQVEDGILYGPAFRTLFAEHERFSALAKEGRYQEAEQALRVWSEERPDDPQLLLARFFLLLERGDVRDAWYLAQSNARSNPTETQHDVLVAIGSAAMKHALAKKDPADRSQLAEVGLAAQEEALAISPQSRAARSVKLMLLWEKRRQTTEATEVQLLAEEIARLEQEMQALRRESE